MNSERLKEILDQLLDAEGLRLYSIRSKRMFGESVAEILVDADGPVSSDQLTRVHLKLMETMPPGVIPDDWSVELSSVGIERPLLTKDDLKGAVGKHIFLSSPVYTGNGDLLAFDDDETIVLKVNRKGRIKTIDIKYADASQIRIAVKF